MEKSISVFRRFMAMLLVFAMLSGYLPAISFAAEGVADETEAVGTIAEVVTSFNVTILREEYADAENDPENEEIAPVEAEEEVTPEDEEQKAYSYLATLRIDGKEVEIPDNADAPTFEWIVGEETVQGPAAENIIDEGSELTLKVTYDGITLIHTFADEDFAQSNEVEVSLKAALAAGEVKLGAAVAAPKEATEQNFTGEWIVSSWNEQYISDGYVVEDSQSAVELAVLQLQGKADEGEEPIVYLQLAWNVEIVPVSYTASFDISGDLYGEWYRGPASVVITIKGDAAVKDATFIQADVNHDDVVWTAVDAGNITWKSEPIILTGDGVHTVKACGSSVEVKIDQETPVVLDAKAGDVYNKIDAEGKLVTVINFAFTVGESGVNNIAISDGTNIVLDNVEFDPVKMTGTAVVEGEIEPIVIVTANNGKVGSNVEGFDVQRALSITYKVPAQTIGTDENGVIFVAGGEITVVVGGAEAAGHTFALEPNASVVTALDQNGNAIAFDASGWSFEDGKWVYVVSLEKGLNALSVKAVDAKGRTAESTFGKVYGVDSTAPVVTVNRSENPVRITDDATEYYNTPVTYTFSISDVFLGNSRSYVSYMREGSLEATNVYFDKDGKAEIRIENGQKLTNITVHAQDASGNIAEMVTVVDAQGNEIATGLAETWTKEMVKYDCNVIVDTVAPKVTVTASSNVEAFYTTPDSDGKVYAVLDPVVFDDENAAGDSQEIILTVIIEDANLSKELLTAKGTEWHVEGNVATAEFKLTVSDHSTGVLEYAFTYEDLAGHNSNETLTLTAVSAKDNTYTPNTPMNAVAAGSYAGKIYIDRRAPGSDSASDVPKITLNTDDKIYKTADGIDLFNSSFEYQMVITDLHQNGFDSGVKSVSWSIDDGMKNTFLTVDKNEKVSEDGIYVIQINAKGEQETDSAKLTVIVEDMVGNRYTYSKMLAVDTKAPVVKAEFQNNDVHNENYYSASRILSVNISDMNLIQSLNDVQILVNGENVLTLDKLSDNIVFKYEIVAEGHYEIQIKAKDLADNSEEKQVPPFIIDVNPPAINVTKTLAKGAERVNSKDGIDYYNGNVTYTVTITDEHLSEVPGGSNAANLTWSFEDRTVYTVALDSEDENYKWKVSRKNGQTVYQYQITVTDGQVLTGINVQAMDNAGNAAAVLNCSDEQNTVFSYDKDTNSHIYGGIVVVDSTAPEIIVNKQIAGDGKFVQTYTMGNAKYDYYDAPITYEVLVRDQFMTKDVGSITVNVYYTDGTSEEVTAVRNTTETAEALDEVKYTFTLDGSKDMAYFKIQAIDNAGNSASKSEPDVTGADRTEFDLVGDFWHYNGNAIVVDTTAPTAELSFSDNVDAFYMNGTDVFVILKEPVNAGSGEMVDSAESVTVTLKVTDKNLAVVTNGFMGIKAGTLTWGEAVAEDGAVTYTGTVSSSDVTADGRLQFEVSTMIADLSNNPLTAEGLVITECENKSSLGETLPQISVDDATGSIRFNVTVDRRRPSSTEGAIPEIEVTPEFTPTRTAGDVELFNGSFRFELKVDDGTDSILDSGVKEVKWSISDPNDVVKSYEFTSEPNAEGVYLIPVEAGKGESNEVCLTVEVMDRVGNRIVYKKIFAVDTLAPRVSYAYRFEDNTTGELKNGAMFSKPISVVVLVEDLNLNAVAGNYGITVTNYTQTENGREYIPEHMGLIDQGDHTYICEIPFSISDEYGITTEVIDYANNDTVKLASDNKFTLDREAPVIEVINSAAAPANTRDGIDYYNSAITYTVTITDNNLSAESGGYAAAMLWYSFEDGTEHMVTLDNGQWAVSEKNGKTTYKHVITVNDGQALTGMAIQAMDDVANAATQIKCNDESSMVFAYAGEVTNTHVYTGTAVVDTTVPEVVVTRQIANDGEFVQTYKKHDYYAEKITYRIDITDNFLNTDAGICNVVVVYTDGSEESLEVVEVPGASGYLADEDHYQCQFTLDGTKVLKDIQIHVVDNAGNVANVTGADRTSFTLNEKIWHYNGNPVVVDTTAPTAQIAFSENVDSFIMNGNTIYAVLAEPVIGNSGMTPNGTQNVTVILTATDRNIAIDKNNVNGVKANTFEWNGETAVNTESTIIYTATSGEVGPNGTVVFTIDAEIVDLAGNTLNGKDLKIKDQANASGLGEILPIIEVNDGIIRFDVVVDRRRPTSGDFTEDQEPVIEVKPNIAPTKTAGENSVDLFNGAFSFELVVNDGTAGTYFSGVKEVKWSISDPNNVAKSYEYESAVSADGIYNIPVDLATEFGESNEVVLTIEAMDRVGNTIMYQKSFGVDTLDPRITYTYQYADGRTGELVDGALFNDPISVTVKIEDLNMDTTFGANAGHYISVTNFSEWNIDHVYVPENMTMEHEDGTITYTYQLPFSVGGVYGVTTRVNDLANNNITKPAEKTKFTLDTIAPVIEVTKTVANGLGNNDYANTFKCVDYYNGEVTYRISIIDENLAAADGGSAAAMLWYQFEDGTEVTVDLVPEDEEIAWNVSEEDGKTIYCHEFTVKDGQVLTGMAVQAMDNVANAASEIECAEINGRKTIDFAYAGEATNMHVYTGSTVVDTTAPAVVVNKLIANEGKRIQTYRIGDVEYAYYAEQITYEILVTDSFLTLDDSITDEETSLGTFNVTLVYTDGTEELLVGSELSEETEILAEQDTYKVTFTLDGSRVLEDIRIQVIDDAGNIASQPDVTNASDTDFEREQSSDTWSYTGNPIVVDTNAPTAEITFSENVDSFYMNGDTIYAVLIDPVIGDSGVESDQSADEVTMTIKVKDQNLAIDNGNVHGVKDNTDDDFAWIGETPVNTDSEIVYTATSGGVNPDGTHTFTIDVEVSDLAGNKLTQENLALTEAAGNTQLGSTVPDIRVNGETGGMKFIVSVDRRRPSSSEDLVAPTITIKPGIIPTTTAGETPVDLFNREFYFELDVTDGAQNSLNSGVKYVRWTIQDPNGVVANVDSGERFTADGKYTINVNLAVANGESNDVLLTIWAMDNVGNLIKFEKTFGVDNLAPRVKITQSNTSPKNEFYFNADQVITVDIEDLNFEPTTSSVTTEVSYNGWQHVEGIRYRTVLTYNTDGDYTFAMQTMDRAENDAVINYTEGLYALQKFTIDKTAPVINVSFTPASPVGTDGKGVLYFDKNRSVNVSINEHNFRSSDVEAGLGSKNALGAWRSSGDIHTASETFTEGNNYAVTVKYTDLAGNVAQPYSSPTFSVDLHAPTIEITKGSMTLGQLNIVPDDLLLGFTINDGESNLKVGVDDIKVEVLFLDINFQQTKMQEVDYYTVSAQNTTNAYIDFSNLEYIKANDGIYTVRVSVSDYAGHVVTLMSDLIFSVNRFGSTFFTDDPYTSSFLTADSTGVVYRQNMEQDLIIKEINPNHVWKDAEKTSEGSVITVTVNGNSTALKKDEDYDFFWEHKGTGGHTWYEYTYRLDKDLFFNGGELADGEYSIFFYSEDDAQNKNTNEANDGSALTQGADGQYTGKIDFTLDHKAPVVTILDIRDRQKIYEANKAIEINVSDNTPVTILVYVNEQLVEQVETVAGMPLNTDWLCYDATIGSYILNISEKDVTQDLRVEVLDAAGNKAVDQRIKVMVSPDLLVQYINSPVAIMISIILVLAAVFVILVMMKKRKKNNEETAETVQN